MTSGSTGLRQLRFLHVSTRYLRGGSERRIGDVARAFPDAHHTLLIGEDSDLGLARSCLPSMDVEIIPHLVREVSPLRDLRALLSLRRLIQRYSADIVFTHQSKAGVVGRIAARSRRVPVVHSLASASFGPGYSPRYSALFSRIERVLARWTSAYAVVGADLASRFETIGVPASKLHVVRSSALPEVLPDAREARARTEAQFKVESSAPIVAYVGALDSRKNVLSLPELHRRVTDQLETSPVLMIAGDGPDRDTLAERLHDAARAGHVRLLGHLADPLDVIGAADALVLLSRSEGLSQVLTQAAALGTPFVAYEVDGAGELLRMGAEGCVVPIDDLEAAARALSDILKRRARGAGIDTTGWSSESISAGYRKMIAAVDP